VVTSRGMAGWERKPRCFDEPRLRRTAISGIAEPDQLSPLSQRGRPPYTTEVALRPCVLSTPAQAR